MIDWTSVRNDFPVCRNIIYFQSAGMSPLSTPVFESICSKYRTIMELGDIYWEDDLRGYRKICQEWADLIHTKADNIGFVQNTSTAMSLLALAFCRQKQEPFNIISMKDEFPATTIPYEHQKIVMRYIQPQKSRYSIESILQQVNKATLAVVTSYVQYNSGFRQDLKTLGQELKKRNILFIVNATQALPFFPVDVETMNISALSASLHKWGGAAHVGALFYTSFEFRQRFPSPVAGWLSVQPTESFIHTRKNEPFSLFQSAQQFEQGTMNLQSFFGLETSLKYFKKIGWEKIRIRIFELADYLINGLKDLPVDIISPVNSFSERSAIITFTTSMDNSSIVTKLEKKKIFPALRDNMIRVSLNIFNNHEDIDTLLKELKGILA